MKLSVIIPVYNVEKTLERCIESVIRQDATDLEVIIVDDGSTDKSAQICDKWAAKDFRIQVIHKKNGGLSDARNAGIEKAQGDYITFVDSDDYIGEHTYAPLMRYLNQHPETDILEYPAILFYNSPKQQELNFPNEHVYHDMKDYWFNELAYNHSYAWNKLYRTSLFKEVRFPTGVVFEDICTLHVLLKSTSTLATINQGRYYYCFNQKGITATADSAALRMHLIHHLAILRETECNDAASQQYYMQVLNIQIDYSVLSGDAPILEEVHLKPAYFKGKAKLKAIALNTLGINQLCKIFQFFKRQQKSPASVL